MKESQREKQFIAYQDLSAWNGRDIASIRAFDRIYIPLTLVGLATAFKHDNSIFVAAYGAGVMLLLFWFGLCWRHKIRIDDRFRVMKTIEAQYCIMGHKDLCEFQGPRDLQIRFAFLVIFIIFGGALCLYKYKTLLPQTPNQTHSHPPPSYPCQRLARLSEWDFYRGHYSFY